MFSIQTALRNWGKAIIVIMKSLSRSFPSLRSFCKSHSHGAVLRFPEAWLILSGKKVKRRDAEKRGGSCTWEGSLCMPQNWKCLVENNPKKHAASSLLRGRIRICVDLIGCSIIPSEALNCSRATIRTQLSFVSRMWQEQGRAGKCSHSIWTQSPLMIHHSLTAPGNDQFCYQSNSNQQVKSNNEAQAKRHPLQHSCPHGILCACTSLI